jgi:hypothetical protein
MVRPDALHESNDEKEHGMAKYLFAYKGGGMAGTEAERDARMAEWGAWFGELGPAIIDGGNPIAVSKVVSSDGTTDGGGKGFVTGYTLVEADSLDAAAGLAGGCPVLKQGGTVEVGETIPM